MYTHQLSALVRLDTVTSRHFRGVFSCDGLLLERFPHNNCFVIVNTAPSTEKGKHWILLFKKTKTILFDSLAKKLSDYDQCVISAIQHFSGDLNKIIHTSKRIQSSSSTFCGYFCLYVAHELSRRKGINSILLKFSNDKTDNDTQIIYWFQYCYLNGKNKRKNLHSKKSSKLYNFRMHGQWKNAFLAKTTL